MIFVYFKKGDPVDYGYKLRKYIKSNYSEDQLKEHEAAIDALTQTVVKVRGIQQADEVAKELLKKYYADLLLLESHFPLTGTDTLMIDFVWYDAFAPKKRSGSPNVNMEKASVMFNLGALFSQQAAQHATSNTGDSLKAASAAYQLAAGTFAYVRDHIRPLVLTPTTPDLSCECLNAIVNMMLGQAQALFTEKAIQDKMRAAVVAKLAASAADYFQHALRIMQSDLSEYFDKHPLVAVVQTQVHMASAQAQYYQSTAALEASKYGEQVARLQLALHHSAEAVKAAAKATNILKEAANRLHSLVERGLQSAIKDNNTIYHEVVPAVGTLALVEKKSMVQPKGAPDIVPQPPASDPWRLIPVHVQRAFTQYQELVNKTAAELTDEMDTQTAFAKSKLQQHNLPEAANIDPRAPVLPDRLIAAVAEIQHQSGPIPVSSSFATHKMIREMSEECAKLLGECERTLADEEVQDMAMRNQHRTRWTRAASRDAARPLLDEVSKHRVHLQTARASDALVQRKLEDAKDKLELLSKSQEDLRTLVPMMVPGTSAMLKSDALRQALAQLDSILGERDGIRQEIKVLTQSNTMLSGLQDTGAVDAASRLQAQFEPLRSRLAANYAAQAAVLNQIEGEAMKLQSSAPEYMRARSQMVADFDAAVTTHMTLQANFSEGVEFYTRFQDTLNKLKDRIHDFALLRNIEKDDHAQAIAGPMANMNLQGSAQQPARAYAPQNPYYQYPPPGQYYGRQP